MTELKQNKTKIIATIGPASSDKDTLRAMIQAGVNVCRINCSHGSYDDHLKVINNIREIDEEMQAHTAILADLQGPKLRVGEMAEGTVLENGQSYILTTDEVEGDSNRAYISYQRLAQDVKKGEQVLINDGKIVLEVTGSNGTNEVECTVVQGGPLEPRKGVNLPNTKISLPSLTEKDHADLEFAIENNVHWIGLSFVRSAADIIELKHIIHPKRKHTKVVAKIEKPQAVEDIDDIIKESDALMVARGDLGVEIPMEDVPMIQKKIVQKCQKAGKPAIIATQMMESMIDDLSPTRAEVNDVANAVMDGADAVMLSGETSVGNHPVEVIENIYKIIIKAQTFPGIYNKESPPAETTGERFISDSICYQSCRLADRTDAVAIVTNSFSGHTGFRISSYRPRAWVYVFTANHKILNMLSMVWGVRAFYYDKFVSTDHTIADTKFQLRKEGYFKERDLVINIASMPITDKGMSNMMKLSVVE